jgi:hypothetical protein
MAYIGSAPNSSTIQDVNGRTVSTLANSGTQTGLATSMVATDFVVSSGNTSSVQLAAGAKFTGAIESIFYYQSISILLASDQNGTLVVNQYIDAAGTQKTTSWSYNIVAGSGFNRSLSGNGNYFNITFTNTGTSATTTFVVHVAYGVIATTTNLGNTATAINEVNGSQLSLGQTTSSSSLPVVLASDQPAIQVAITNPVNTVTVANPVNTVTVANPVNSVTVLNPVNTVTVANPVSTVTVANPVTSVGITGSVTVANPVSTVTVANPVNAVDVNNVFGQVTIANPVTTVTVANPVNTVTVANPVNTVTVANPVNTVTVANPVSTVTVANPVTTVAVSNTNLSVTDSILAAAQSTDNPIKVSITGDETGDFAGVNILEQVVSDGTGIAFNTRTLNAPKVDVNNAQIPSDAPPSATLYLGVNVPQMIDTTGYQSVVFQQTAAVSVTVTQSNDGVNFVAIMGIPTTASGGAYVSSTAATAQAVYAYPISARYMRFQAAAQTSLIVYLRQTPFASYAGLALPSVVISSGTVTANTQGGTAVGSAPGTNPNLVAGTDYNGLTRRIQTDVNGNSQVVGQLPQGYQVATYNVTYGPYTQSINPITTALSSVNPVMIGGVDQTLTARRIQTDTLGSQLVRGSPSAVGQQSLEELLTQILGTLRVLTHYIYEEQLMAGFRSTADEPDMMLADYLNPASSLNNMTN